MAKKENNKKLSPSEQALLEGIEIVKRHPLFGRLLHLDIVGKSKMQEAAGIAFPYGFYLNKDVMMTPEEWAYTIAHCTLHRALGHFDADKMPGYDKPEEDGKSKKVVLVDKRAWNIACDIYISKFLTDIKFGRPTCSNVEAVASYGNNEKLIYQRIMENGFPEGMCFGTAGPRRLDMSGLDEPLTYDTEWKKSRRFSDEFARALAYSVSAVVGEAGGISLENAKPLTNAGKAANWFLNHYPLLGSLAAGFHLIEDAKLCMEEEISVAAINVTLGEIYINPASGYKEEEWKFILAHEYLHAGLEHHKRCQGRDPYLWNIACDYVINGWLKEMGVGSMPLDGLMYDPELKGLSAEEIYDRIVRDIRTYRKLSTFRGYNKGDVIEDSHSYSKVNGHGGILLDDFCRNALMQGLEYHTSQGRGLIPAGLIQEIRALAMPPIPWDVQLGKWFDVHFLPVGVHRTYARPSRRQGSTPDIPRARVVPNEIPENSRTFGVVIDTSGSMSAQLIGYALGAIASYSATKEVPFARVVFCDADAYDAGYLSPEDIAGRVEVKGRGGTILQPGVDLLLQAQDFPKDAPILIITDGMIESDLRVRREHAYLIPKGNRLPFRPAGEVFYFQ